MEACLGVVAMLSALMLTGCSEAKDKAAPRAKATPKAPVEETSKSVAALHDAFEALPASPPLLPPLEHQLGTSYTKTKLLGFTKDYRAYAVAIEHDYLFDNGEGEFKLHMHQVFDTWTGEGIAAYEVKVEDKRGERFGDNDYHRSLQRFVTQLESDSDWDSWLAQNPLIKVKAQRKTDAGEFKIAMTRRPPLGSKMATTEVSTGFRVKWSNLPSGEMFEAAKRKPRTPRLLASWIPNGEDAQPSVSFRPEMAWINRNGDPKNNTTQMQVKAYPTPDERRVLWLLQPSRIHGDATTHDPLGRVFMRALGRQIKVVHAGSGVDPARRASAHLEANGLTIAAISKQAKDSEVSGIYYRGDALDIAKNVQELLPGKLPIEELQANGWVDVIIVLGMDVGPEPDKLVRWGADATAALEAAPPVNLTAMVEPATAATNNCPTVRLRATQDDTLLDDVPLQEECEDAPDYSCEESGEGCETTTYEIGKQVTVEGRPYIWIHTIYSMKDNEIGSSALYGYGCGGLTVAWSFTNQDQGDFFEVELREGKRGLTAIMSENAADGTKAETSKERLVWRPAKCIYERK